MIESIIGVAVGSLLTMNCYPPSDVPPTYYAGQMIENVTKSVRRKQTVDEQYLEELFADVTSLYRLDQHTADPSAAAGDVQGPLPAESRFLLGALAAAWLLMGAYAGREALKKYRKKRESH